MQKKREYTSVADALFVEAAQRVESVQSRTQINGTLHKIFERAKRSGEAVTKEWLKKPENRAIVEAETPKEIRSSVLRACESVANSDVLIIAR